MCGAETEQGLKSGHRMLAPVMTKDEFIEINLKLFAAHAVVGADQPLLQVPDGPIGQWHYRFRAFAKIALQGLGAWNMRKRLILPSGRIDTCLRLVG